MMESLRLTWIFPEGWRGDLFNKIGELSDLQQDHRRSGELVEASQIEWQYSKAWLRSSHALDPSRLQMNMY
jgi:hypothetical protein